MTISIASFFRRLRVLLCFRTDEKDDDIAMGDDADAHIDYTKTLPESVLAVIFLHCTALSVHSSSPFIYPHPSAAPLSLSQASSFWRKVALNTPAIWSSIHVRNTTRQEILHLWLTRSGTNSDLNLRIEAVHTLADLAYPNELALHPFIRNPPLHTSTRVGRAWTFLVSQIHRWRRVEFELDVQTTFDFLDLPLTKAARLKDLSITVIVRDAHVFPTRILDYLRVSVQSPTLNLQKLSWDCIPTESMPAHGIWGCLREVHLNMGVTMDQSVQFLRGCVQAEVVTVACITNDCMERMEHELQLEAAYRELMTTRHNPLPPPQRHVLPILRRLSIGLGGVVGDCIPIIQFFILPALISLEMQSFDTSMRSCMLLEGFFARSAGVSDGRWDFRRLSIVDHHTSEKIMAQLLSAPASGMISVPEISY